MMMRARDLWPVPLVSPIRSKANKTRKQKHSLCFALSAIRAHPREEAMNGLPRPKRVAGLSHQLSSFFKVPTTTLAARKH